MQKIPLLYHPPRSPYINIWVARQDNSHQVCPGDIIIKEGTIGSKMYFIQEGIVDVIMGTGEVHNYKIK